MSTAQSKQQSDTPSHGAGTGKGEEINDTIGSESGRHEKLTTGAARPAGARTARDSTSINPDDEQSITPGSVEMPPA